MFTEACNNFFSYFSSVSAHASIRVCAFWSMAHDPICAAVLEGVMKKSPTEAKWDSRDKAVARPVRDISAQQARAADAEQRQTPNLTAFRLVHRQEDRNRVSDRKYAQCA